MVEIRSQRDAPGTLREYETIFILNTDASTERIQDINNRIRNIINEADGKLIKVENWGKRKLAYEIRKQLKGIYLFWQYLGEAGLVAEIERNLRMLDLVVRYLTVCVDHGIHPEMKTTQMSDETFLEVATTFPDEEDTYMGRGLSESSDEEGFEGEDEFGDASFADAEDSTHRSDLLDADDRVGGNDKNKENLS